MPQADRPRDLLGDPAAPALKRYFDIVREHILLVLACVVVVLAATVVYVKTAPKTYQAEAEMLVSPASSSDTTLSSLPVLHASGDPTADVLTAANLVTTPAVADAVRKQLHLTTSRAALLGKLQANPIGQANLIAIQASASSPQQAALLANAFVTQVVNTRATALHTAVSTIIPNLQSQVAGLPASDRTGPGTVGQQLNELRQFLSTGDPTITPAASADPPGSPSSPKTKLSLVAGLLAGLLIGLAAAFVRHALDPRLRREEQVSEILDAPVLARIPRERLRVSRPILYSDMSAGAQEGFRTLRTILSSRSSGKPRSILVTGASPGEGKSTTALALAFALGQSGARVVLIEADVRRPTIASVLGTSPQYGTEDVMSGRATLLSAVQVIPGDDGRVGVVAVREPQVRVVDRLSRPVAQSMVDAAAEIADFVVIDSPPLTAVIDALPLAQVASELLVVSRIGVSRLNRLRSLNKLLNDQNLHPTGVVLLGDVSVRTSPYYRPGIELGEPMRGGSAAETSLGRSGKG